MVGEVVLRWSGEGEKVQVAGDWSEWKPEDLIEEGGNWQLKLNLPPGKYQLKWVVDGVWTVNRAMPVVMSIDGNENNEIEVRMGRSESGSQDSLDSWEQVEIPSKEEELEKHGLEDSNAEATAGVEVEPSQLSTSEESSKSVPISDNEKSHPFELKVISTDTSLKEESISVVERVFNVDHATTLEALKLNRAELLEEEEFEDEYWDTEDFTLTRKGLWLRLRRKEGAGTECWQLRKLEQQSKLNLVTEEKAVAFRLKEELGMEGEEVPEVMEVLLGNQFKKMLSFHGSSSRWRLGVVDVELRRENKMDTAVVKVVGEVMAALQDLHANAEMLHLMPLHVKTLGGGGGVGSGAA